MKRDLDAASSRLLSLAAGLAQDCGIAVKVLDQRRWAWDPVRRVLMVGRPSIEEHGVEGCLGYVAHEIGHCLVTRYLDFRMPGSDPDTAKLVMNAIEDPRAELFMMRRYPGAGRWIRAVHGLDENRLAHTGDRVRASLKLRFLIECVREFHNGWQQSASDLPTAVAAALEQTRDARRRYTETLPEASLVPDRALRSRYAVVRAHLIKPPLAPDEREEAVLVSAWQAFEIARDEILPVALALCIPNEEQSRARYFGPAAPGLELDGELGDRSPDTPSAAASIGLPDEGVKVRGRSDDKRVEPVDYESLRCTHDAAIERLARDVEEILQPRRHPRAGGAYPHRARPDLRLAMRAEADPRECARLWLRQRVPERGDLAVFVLVDLSGSMAHCGKDDAAVAGTLIVIETLARLPFVRWAAAGFQDELIALAAFHEGITPAVRRGVASMKLEIRGCNEDPGARNEPLFNDDGPAVAAAAQQLLAIAAARRMLIVISDGVPEGKHSTERDLWSWS